LDAASRNASRARERGRPLGAGDKCAGAPFAKRRCSSSFLGHPAAAMAVCMAGFRKNGIDVGGTERQRHESRRRATGLSG
jgi:hypothetical protein